MSQNRRYLMQRSLSTTCWSDAHSAHIATVTLPAIILYLIVCPLFLTLVKRIWFFFSSFELIILLIIISFFRSSRFFLFFFKTLVRLRQQKVLYADDVNYKPHWTIRYGFVFAGYEPKYAWWEMVVLIRKAAFVLVTVFTRPGKSMEGPVTLQSQRALMFWFFFCCFFSFFSGDGGTSDVRGIGSHFKFIGTHSCESIRS